MMNPLSSTIVQAEFAWLNLTEFTRVSGLSSIQVEELVDMGVLTPQGSAVGDWQFNPRALALARQFRRLREDLDLELDLQALALGFRLLERIETLERQLCHERACHPRD